MLTSVSPAHETSTSNEIQCVERMDRDKGEQEVLGENEQE